MSEELDSLKKTLFEGIKKSTQGSYSRRQPSEASIPFLMAARSGLKELAQKDEKDEEVFRLLSQAEEFLLNYRDAISYLEHAMHLTKSRSKNDLKRLAQMRSSLKDWDSLFLSPEQLKSLGDYLVQQGANDERRGRTLQHTRQWLSDNGIASPELVLEALSMRGAFTDFQVVFNIVRG